MVYHRNKWETDVVRKKQEINECKAMSETDVKQTIAENIVNKIEALINGRSFRYKLDDKYSIFAPQVTELSPENSHLTIDVLKDFFNWIVSDGVNPVTGGAYAMKEVLKSRGIAPPVEQIAEAILAIDIFSGIIRPYDQSIKNSMYSITYMLASYLRDSETFESAKLSPVYLGGINLPLIANLSDEAYVSVLSINGDTVNFNYMGQTETGSLSELAGRLSGFVIAANIVEDEGIPIEIVSPEMQSFIWG